MKTSSPTTTKSSALPFPSATEVPSTSGTLTLRLLGAPDAADDRSTGVIAPESVAPLSPPPPRFSARRSRRVLDWPLAPEPLLAADPLTCSIALARRSLATPLLPFAAPARLVLLGVPVPVPVNAPDPEPLAARTK